MNSMKNDMAQYANEIRKSSLKSAFKANLGHPGSDLSCADIVSVLLSKYVHRNVDSPLNNDRNRFVMSKGHAALAYYSALNIRKIIEDHDYDTFSQKYSLLSGHPASQKIDVVEVSTGPLGHGLPIATGMALAGKMHDSNRKIFVLCGDGEMQEGSNWEAIMFAAHYQLSNLICIVDRNRLQHAMSTENVVSLVRLPEMFKGFGWDCVVVDGNNVDEIDLTLKRFENDEFLNPLCVIAETQKGRGVSFMEDHAEWHHKIPSKEQLTTALEELNELDATRITL